MVDELIKIDAYWRASNYYTVALMYLKDNIYLKRKLQSEDLKKYSSGHWGTCPGVNFILAHLNYYILQSKRRIQLTIGPGHAGNALFVNLLLEGTLQKYYSIFDDKEKIIDVHKLQKCISILRTEINPSYPGMIYDGGELGYSLPVAFGTVIGNKELLNVCIIGDGEFETGTISATWRTKVYFNHSSGKVLPIIHLNGYRMGDSSILSKFSDEEICKYFESMNYQVRIVRLNHIEMIEALEWAEELYEKESGWPIIILKSPKGYSAPDTNIIHIQGNSDSHKNPLYKLNEKQKIEYLQKWLESYRPNELFNERGELQEYIKDILPADDLKIGNSLSYYDRKELNLPSVNKYEIEKRNDDLTYRNIEGIKHYLKEIIRSNHDRFIVVSPDELKSNLLAEIESDSLEEQTIWEILNENICQAWMQGYVLSGRNAVMISYEAFMPIISSMISQYAKWIYQSNLIGWRKKKSSLNYILTSVWEANTYSHQNPVFIDQLLLLQAEFVRIYMPIDSNTTLKCLHTCLVSENYINAIVCSKQPMPQYVDIVEAEKVLQNGLFERDFYEDGKKDTDLILLSAGDYCARESRGAIEIIRRFLPELHIKHVALLELTSIGDKKIYKHAIDEITFNHFFPPNVPIVFCYHGFTSGIKALMFDRFKNKEVSILGYENKSIYSENDLKKMEANGNSRYDIIIKASGYLKDKCSKEILAMLLDYSSKRKMGADSFD